MTVFGDHEYAAMKARTMAEKPFQEIVVAAAKRDGWLVYHTHDSRRSEPGFPDLVLLHPQHGRILYRELKTQKGKPTADQTNWLNALTAAGQDAKLWRPYDWFIGTIATEISTTTRPEPLGQAPAPTDDITPDPDCAAGKHHTCFGTGWNFTRDEPCPCPCACHDQPGGAL